MPIRFRCAYCNQLMGISSRKAGTVVKCPKCAGEIIVPIPDGEAPIEPSGPEAASSGSFEEKDFEQYFDEASNGSAAVATPAAPEPRVPEPMLEPTVTAEPPPPQRRGLFLSLAMLFVSLAVIVVLLIAMFVAGFLIGRPSTPHPQSIEAEEPSAIQPPGHGGE